LLILSLSLADIAFVLHFDKIDLDNDSANLDNMPDQVISLDCLQESQGGIRLEVTDLIFDLSDYLEVFGVVKKLHIDVKVVGDLPEGICDKDHIVFENKLLQIESRGMSDKERDLGLVINTLNIDLSVNHVLAAASHAIKVLALLIKLLMLEI
jgi:hypothetical protein